MDQLEIKTRCDKAIKILELTNDGDDLSPFHLSVVESYVNGNLNNKGIEELEKIYSDVINGIYKESWYCGVENITIDHEGYVYYKKINVEHFSTNWMSIEKQKKGAEQIARICKILEEENIPINFNNYYDRLEQEENNE